MYLDPENLKKFLLVKSKDNKKDSIKVVVITSLTKRNFQCSRLKVKEEIKDSHSQGSLRLTEEILQN